MNQRDVLARGAKGEQLVAEILKDLKPTLGYAYVNDILLDFNGKTAQIDHVLIDRYGILVIETKMSGAVLKGKSEDRQWTACYRSGKTHQMFNPLVQNEGHRKWLHKLLTQNGRDLPENYVQSLIVFADGVIDHLELSDVDVMRVVSRGSLKDFIRARYDFQPNVGQLGHEAQLDLYEFLVASNRRSDSVTWERHLESCKRAQGKSSLPARGNRPWPAHDFAPGPATRRRAPTPRSYTPRYGSGRELTARQALQFAIAIALLIIVSACGSCASTRIPPTSMLPQSSTQAVAQR